MSAAPVGYRRWVSKGTVHQSHYDTPGRYFYEHKVNGTFHILRANGTMTQDPLRSDPRWLGWEPCTQDDRVALPEGA